MDIFEYARELRKTSTRFEKLIWRHLCNRKFHGFKFRRQSVIQFRFIADFYCPSKKLIIEIDGKIHKQPEVKSNDIIREKELINLGYNILRFSNDEVEQDIDQVLKKIKTVLEGL